MELPDTRIALTIFLALSLISICLAERVKRQRIIFPDDIDILKSTTSAPVACDCQLTTNEYNPVCGSDGVTYFNPQKLKCAIKCGTNVRLVKGGRCKPIIGPIP